MKYVCLILSLIATGASAPRGSGEPVSKPATRPTATGPAHTATSPQPGASTTTRPTSAPTSGPHYDPKIRSLVRKLVAELGAPAYLVRETAQKRLAKLGEKAMPHLVEFIGSGDPEVSNRITAMIKRPDDPHLRIEVAVRLLTTADPDWMEPAVHMLFETPTVDHELFVRRTAGAKGIEQAIFEPVAEQLHTWKRMTDLFDSRQERLLREKRFEAARKERKLHEGSKLYQAEAAYWSAVEEMEEYKVPKPARRNPATRPGGN